MEIPRRQPYFYRPDSNTRRNHVLLDRKYWFQPTIQLSQTFVWKGRIKLVRIKPSSTAQLIYCKNSLNFTKIIGCQDSVGTRYHPKSRRWFTSLSCCMYLHQEIAFLRFSCGLTANDRQHFFEDIAVELAGSHWFRIKKLVRTRPQTRYFDRDSCNWNHMDAYEHFLSAYTNSERNFICV